MYIYIYIHVILPVYYFVLCNLYWLLPYTCMIHTYIIYIHKNKICTMYYALRTMYYVPYIKDTENLDVWSNLGCVMCHHMASIQLHSSAPYLFDVIFLSQCWEVLRQVPSWKTQHSEKRPSKRDQLESSRAKTSEELSFQRIHPTNLSCLT